MEGARAAFLDGLAGLVWAQGGTPRVDVDITLAAGTVIRTEMTAEPDGLGGIEIEFLRRPHRRCVPRDRRTGRVGRSVSAPAS